MTDIKLRLTKYNCTDEELVNHMLTVAPPDKIVIVHEEIGRDKTPKPHYHIWCQPIITIPTFRTRLLKDWKITERGNESYSIGDTHHNWDVHVGYLFKHVNDLENPTRVVYEPPDFNRQYYIDQYDNHCKTDTEKSAKTKNQNKDIQNYVDATTARTPRDIAKAVIDYYAKHNMTFHKANIGAMVNMIWYKQGNTDSFIDQVLEAAGLENPVLADARYYRQQNEELRMRLKYENSRKLELDDPE